MKRSMGKMAKILLIAIFCISMILLVSCQPTEDPVNPVEEYDIDNVFFMEENGQEYLFTISGNSFLISGWNGDQRGTFTYEDNALTLTFKEGDTTNASATLEDDVLKLVYNGNTYRLVKRNHYAVTFVDGNATIGTDSVLNSLTVAKPDDPIKDGYAFLGWYADATFNTPYAFETPITKDNTMIYARFEKLQAGITEHTVTFSCEGTAYPSVRTVNGIVYNLPTPVDSSKTFAGWWVSDYQNGTKLTYQYNGQVLTQDTTLYAVFKESGVPLLSVNENGITWDAQGAGSSYKVTITKDTSNGSITVAENSVGATEFAFDFQKQEAGDYSIKVEVNGKTATAFYKNKALDRVSGMRVVSSGVLVFNPVANAEKYLITILCGNENHVHTLVNNGNSTNYNFANCMMPAEGIKFVITAQADGYLDSTSEVFVHSLTLDKVTELIYNDNTVTWSAVENATGYYVETSTDNVHFTKTLITSGPSFKLDELDAGNVYIKVTPYNQYYYAEPSDTLTIEKKSLAIPYDIAVKGTDLVWAAVKGATGYTVKVGDKEFTATTNSLALTDLLTEGQTSYDITVQALGEGDAKSPVSAVATVNYETMGEVWYENGYVCWTPVVGATGYRIIVDGRSYTADANTNRLAVTFTRADTIDISVCFINGNYDESKYVSTQVTTYMLELDTRGGAAVASIFPVIGDEIHLPDTKRDGYDFAGWYLTPNGLNNNGRAFEAERFDDLQDLVLYAAWINQKFTITFDIGNGSCDATEAIAVYGKINKVAVAKTPDATRIFTGWFTEPNGTGIRYFDENGVGLSEWNSLKDVTLYAYYAEVLKYELISNGTAYAVSMGDYGIGNATSLTIPATYNGLPVTTIEASAFYNCSTLVEINIPNSIENIELGINGVNGTGSAFASCNKLAAINIIEVPGVKEPRYFSLDGVLYCNNEFNGVELKAVPYAKTGILNVAEGTMVIPTNAIRSSKLTELYIPYTVTTINANGIYSNSSLTKIVFLASPEGVEELPLILDSKAIYSASQLTSITFPARLADFKADSIGSCAALTTIDIIGEGGNYSAKGENGRKVLCNKVGDTLIYCPKGMSGDYTIPSGVSVIGESAFASCALLTSVKIPGFVTEIGKNAFKSCSEITSLTFEEGGSALTIRESAFYSCSRIGELTLPSHLVKMEKNAFGNISGLIKVTVNSAGKLPEGAAADADKVVDFSANAFATTAATPDFYVKEGIIGKDVPIFDVSSVFGQKIENVNVHKDNKYYASVDGILYDNAITSVIYYPLVREGSFVLPDTVTKLSENVFRDRVGLTGITIGKNVTEIGNAAFYGCTALAEIRFLDGGTEPLTIGDQAFYNCKALTELKLPNRTTTIGNEAFRLCNKVTSFTIPEGVTHIGMQAFYSCSAMTKVVLPSTLQEMMPFEGGLFNTFYACAALTEISISGGESNYYAVIDGVLYKKSAVEKDGKTDYVITDLAFCPQKSKSAIVHVPGTVNNVYSQAFYVNNSVTEVIFEDLVDPALGLNIGANAFGSAKKLTKVTLPNGLKVISEQMFYMCETIQEMIVPNTVTSIKNKAFAYCKALSKLEFEEGGTEPLVIEDVTTSTSDSNTSGAFYKCESLKEVTFPERMTVLGTNAFGGATSYATSGGSMIPECVPAIEVVHFPSTLERIGQSAFMCARHLTTVTFAEGTKLKDGKDNTTNAGIGASAFAYTSGLKSIELPDAEGSTYSIGPMAFNYSGIGSAYLPKSVTTIGMYAFQHCRQLTDIVFGEGANPAFNGGSIFADTAIKELIFAEGLTSIGSNMFQDCKQLTKVVLPFSVTKLDTSAFFGCTNLSDFSYKTDENGYSNLNTINSNAFKGTALTSFVFPTLKGTQQLTLNSSGIFNSCNRLETVTLSKSIKSLEGVFTGCTSVKNIIVPDDAPFYADNNAQILYSKDKTTILLILCELSGEFTIPDTVISIPNGAFKGQAGITKLIIPKTVQSIGNNAFQYCLSLQEVVFEHSESEPSQMKTYGTYMFDSCRALEKVTLPGNITTLPNYMFRYCPLKEIVLPEGLTSIGNNVFQETALEEVVIPSTLKTIGTGAFMGKSYTAGNPNPDVNRLRSVTFQKNLNGTTALETISQQVFQYQRLESVVIPKSVKTMPNANAFGYNSELRSVVFEDGCLLNSVGTYTFANCPKLETITIPKNLKTLGNYMFANDSSLKSIKFENPEGITSFGTYVFQNCISLTSFTVPENVTSLNNYCFDGCSGLKEFKFDGNKVTLIGTYCFRNCTSLEEFTIPSSVTVLGTSATAGAYNGSAYQFSGCTALKHVTLSPKLKLISGYVFDGCTALESIDIPDTVTQLGSYAFRNCTSLAHVNFGEKSALTVIGPYCFQNSGLESIEIPAGVKFLGATNTAAAVSASAYTFDGCTKLKSVVLPATLTQTAGYVFRGCTALESITLPANTTQLGYYLFQNCTSLKEINIPAKVTNIGNYAFDGCTALEKVTFENSTAGLTTGTYMFRNCTALKEITLPDRVAKVSQEMFSGCTNLSSVTVNKATIIDKSAFKDCVALKTLTLPETLTEIGDSAFSGSGLTALNLPKNVAKIGANAFNGCNNLASVSVDSANTTYTANDNCLIQLSDHAILVLAPVSGDTLTLGENMILGAYALVGHDNVTTIEIEDGVTTIPAYAFANSNVSSVILPESLTFIGEGAFTGTKITSINIPANVTGIASKAFQNCAELKEITFADDNALTAIGTYAFAGTAIEEIVLPAGVTKLGAKMVSDTLMPDDWITSYTFQNCASLKSVQFLGELEVINGQAFENCTSLKNFDIPKTVTIIGSKAFLGSGIESVVIPAGVKGLYLSSTTYQPTSGNSNTFQNCVNLKSVVFEGDIYDISGYAFDGCTALEKVTIPASATSIVNYAFRGCTSLKNIDFAEDSILSSIGMYAFQNCTSLESIVIPDSVLYFNPTSSTATYTFDGCTSLKSVTLPEGFMHINGYSFRGCTSLETINLHNVTYFGSYAFYGSGLKEVTIPGTITSMSTFVFAECKNLEKVVVEDGVTSLGSSMFSNCTALKSVTLPQTIGSISSKAFENCTSLKTLVLPILANPGANCFEGWTEDQTIYAEATKMGTFAVSTTGWTATWMGTGKAKIVYGYKAN